MFKSVSWKIAAFLLAVIATGSAFLSSRNLQALHEGSRSLAQVEKSTLPAPLLTTNPGFKSQKFHPEPGKIYHYEFNRTIKLEGLEAWAPSGSDFNLHYQGELFISIVKVYPGSWSARTWVEVKESSVTRAHVAPVALSIRVDDSGQLLELKERPVTQPEEVQEQNVLKDLVAQWLFFSSQDTVGTYVAQIHWEENRAKKVKLHYVTDSESLAALPKVTQSEHWMTWDSTLGMPSKVTGQEQTQMSFTQKDLLSYGEYEIKFVSAESGSALLGESGDEKVTHGFKLSAQSTIESGALDWRGLELLLLNLEAKSSSEQLQVFGNLIHSIRHENGNLDLISKLVSLLESQSAIEKGSSSPLFRVVLGAMISAGTPESLAAATQIYQNPNCPALAKGMILAAMTTTQATLDVPTIHFLISVLKQGSGADPILADLVQGAGFALGGALQNLRDPQVAGQVISEIHDLHSASPEALLDMMGNSGRVEFLPDIQTVLNDPNAPIALRAKAVFALRFIKSPTAVATLSAMATSPELPIQMAAKEAIALAD